MKLLTMLGEKKRERGENGRLAYRLPSRSTLLWEFRQLLLVSIGALIAAFGYVVFQVPFNLSAGGLGGISIIINHYTGLPVGLTFWVMSLPLMFLGFFFLGRWPFLWRTLLAGTLFSVFTDLLTYFLPLWISDFPLTDNLLLNTIYGGIVGGIGGGFIYMAGSTIPGSSVISRIVQQKTGMPLSQVYLFVDGAIILASGLVFGWEIPLYGFLMLFINGIASDYTLEGPSRTRTVSIVTNRPQAVSKAIIEELNRGTSYWEITGGYTGETRYLVMSTITRPQVNDLKRTVSRVDKAAFVTIGVGHHALGSGFLPLKES